MDQGQFEKVILNKVNHLVRINSTNEYEAKEVRSVVVKNISICFASADFKSKFTILKIFNLKF